MAFLNWKDDYSVGIKTFDEHHRTLFRLINDYIDAVKRGTQKDLVSPILHSLIDYAATHFKAEEDLMRRYDYPDILHHKESHDRFIEKVTDLNHRAEEGTLNPDELGRFLMDWLVHHILGTDRAYSAFFRAHGVT